ncbi:MAG: FHA domain-containing protein [Ktedonobacteraceae bacterium]
MHRDDKAPDTAFITFLKGSLVGQTFPINKPVTTIGRHVSNDIFIPDPHVSRYHARLLRNEQSWSIENLSQSSSITVDQKPIQQGAIRNKSEVDLGGDTSFLFSFTLDDEQLESTRLATPSSTSISSPASPTHEAVLISTGPEPSPPPVARTEIASFSALGIPSLEVTDNTTGVHKKYPLAQTIINIGRDHTNDIVIDDPIVSDFHLQIARQNNQWVLIHPQPGQQQTRNGLLYLGNKLRGNQPFQKPLMRGDVFRIEDEHGTLITLAYNDGSAEPQVILPSIQPIPLNTSQMNIGRLQDNDVVLQHPQVSAHHASLTAEGATHRLSDLNSSNRTYVNGISITSTLLKPDDQIHIGPYRLIYTGSELRQYDESVSIGIDAVDLKKVGSTQTVLLNSISLSIPPRSFVALVGGSGTGKSTLMDALSGLRPAQEGSVFYNGQDYYRHLSTFRSQLGYVPQEDIIHRDITVERALYYAARLRLPADFTQEQIGQRIDEVLEDVEMTHRRSLLIKKLSGGQRKRVSIALELLANPSIFFLDEPTSGLDPGLDRKMMLLLRKLADKGHTILLVTHATNNINVCDMVCFLAQGGRLAYFGPPEEAKAFFKQPDFAEIYNSLEPTDEQPAIPQEAEERFRKSPTFQKYIAQPLLQITKETAHVAQTSLSDYSKEQHSAKLAGRSNPLKQFGILCQRYIELLWNDKWNLAILLLQAPFIGVILFILLHTLNETTIFKAPISLANQGDAQRFLFILSFASIMFGCINASREIIKEIHIYERERTVNLGIIPYLLSKITILGTLCLLQCAVLLAIMALATHFYQGIFTSEVWETYITIALVAIGGVMIGLTISALVRNNDQAMSFIPLLLLPQIIFSGSMFPLKNIPMQIFGTLFLLRWGMAALGSSLNLIGNGDKVFGTCDACNTYQHNLHYLLLTWGAIIASILLLTILTTFLLKRRDFKR